MAEAGELKAEAVPSGTHADSAQLDEGALKAASWQRALSSSRHDDTSCTQKSGHCPNYLMPPPRSAAHITQRCCQGAGPALPGCPYQSRGFADLATMSADEVLPMPGGPLRRTAFLVKSLGRPPPAAFGGSTVCPRRWMASLHGREHTSNVDRLPTVLHL